MRGAKCEVGSAKAHKKRDDTNSNKKKRKKKSLTAPVSLPMEIEKKLRKQISLSIFGVLIALSFIFTSTGPWEVLSIGSDDNDHKAIEEALGDPDLQGKVTNAVNEHFSHETLQDVRNVLLEMLVVNPVKRAKIFIGSSE